MDGSDIGKCPVMGNLSKTVTANETWWPNQLNVKILNQNTTKSDPMDEDFD